MENQNNNYILFVALKKFIDENNIQKVNIIYKNFHPTEIYEKIKDWNISYHIYLFEKLPAIDAANLFVVFETNEQVKLIDNLTKKTIQKIFSNFYVDEAVDILEEFPYKVSQRIVSFLDDETKDKINQIFKYSQNEAGFHMNVDFITVRENVTIKEAREDIKNKINNDDLEINGNIFVVDERNRVLGFLTPDQIIALSSKEIVKNHINKIETLKITDLITDANEIIDKYDVTSVPVVDYKNKIVGVIELEDIIERYEKVEEQLLEASNVKRYSSKSYLDVTSWDIFKARYKWIVLLVIIGSITQIIVMIFQIIWQNQGLISSVATSSLITLALITSISVASSATDTAGNSGSQTTTNLIRLMAIGEVKKEHHWIVVKKEFVGSLYIGSAAAVTAFFRMFFVWLILGQFTSENINAIIDTSTTDSIETVGQVIGWYTLIATIAASMFLFAVVIGNMMGTMLPMVAEKFNIDGSVFSGPVQTTIADILIFTIYLTITTIIFVPLVNSGVIGV